MARSDIDSISSTSLPRSKSCLPIRTCLPSTVPWTPPPVTESKLKTSESTSSFSFAASTIERANGCSLLDSTAATMARNSLSFRPISGLTCNSVSFGRPSVSVPVLSTINVSTFSMASKTSAFLIRTPSLAPRPTPTIIDIGVANPKAQGQAIINTATALTSA